MSLKFYTLMQGFQIKEINGKWEKLNKYEMRLKDKS